jgi:hypothetical protein
MKLYLCTLVFCLLAPLFPTPSVQAQGIEGDPVAFETVESYFNSNIESKKNVVITNSEDWQHFYKKVHSTLSGMPMIDFSQYTVIAVFAGNQVDSTYRTTITKIVNSGKQYRVFIKESYNGPTCPPGPPVLVQPYHIILTNKIKKAEKRVSFENPEVEVKICQ